MERILNEFVCISKTQENEMTMYVQTIFKPENFKPYLMRFVGNTYENGIKISKMETELYFNSAKDMNKRYELQYNTEKENENTIFIKVTK